jgi:Domain of unknown function (DUF4136)
VSVITSSPGDQPGAEAAKEAAMSSSRKRVFSRIALAAALVVCVAGSVIAQDVKYNAMPGTDFSKFKTYKWVTIEGAKYPDQIMDQQIKGSIDAQLAKKGFTKTDDEKADLYVGYQVAIGKEQQWNSYGTGGYGWRYGGGMSTMTSTTINIGMLGLDVYDPAGKQLIWRGSASKTLDENPSPEKRQKNLDKAMAKLLKNFPPPVKK